MEEGQIDIQTSYQCIYNMINSSLYGQYQLSDMNNRMFFLGDIYKIMKTAVDGGEADFINGILRIIHEPKV